MAKRFMYVCLGILALALAFHLGARYGSASIVDRNLTGVIAHDGLAVLLDNGEVWYSPEQSVWMLRTDIALPVSLSEVKFWNAGHLVTYSNELWVFSGSEWQNRGCPSGLAGTPVGQYQPTTWGQIKAKFGE